jgi:hypothetical protein
VETARPEATREHFADVCVVLDNYKSSCFHTKIPSQMRASLRAG